MKVIVAGSRNIDSRIAFYEVLSILSPYGEFSLSLSFEGEHIDQFITGMCPTGPDQVPYLINNWRSNSGYGSNFDIVEFPADWDKHGRAAGPIRNRQMAEYADSLILIWDGKSRGSSSMKNEMKKLGKPVFELIL